MTREKPSDAKFLLIDFENDPNQLSHLPEHLQAYSHIIVCHALDHAKLHLELLEHLAPLIIDKKFQIVKMARPGQNSADFGITFHAGRLSALYGPGTEFDIATNDAHLDHAIQMLRDLGHEARRIPTLGKTPKKPKAVAGKPAAAPISKSAPESKPSPAPSPKSKPATTAPKAPGHKPAKDTSSQPPYVDEWIIDACEFLNRNRAQRPSTLTRLINSIQASLNTTKDLASEIVDDLEALNLIEIKQNGRLTYAGPNLVPPSPDAPTDTAQDHEDEPERPAADEDSTIQAPTEEELVMDELIRDVCDFLKANGYPNTRTRLINALVKGLDLSKPYCIELVDEMANRELIAIGSAGKIRYPLPWLSPDAKPTKADSDEELPF